jgi:hypothetical protein
MDAAAKRIAGCAWLAAAGMALILAPIWARADDSPNDRHEIPTFVLKRTELATETNAADRIAAGATAANAAFPGVAR